jgi:CubicO group peptidase (beta-lactamase class C family)
MRSRTLCLAFALFVVWAVGTPASAAQRAGPSSLDRFILAQMLWSHTPGLSAVIVKNGTIVWQGAYGFRDAAMTHPVTPDTLFELASLSKTVLAVAVLQLVEQGKLALDNDVSAALPFKVRNPNFPDRPITLRMLLGHVSGIVDNWPLIKAHSVENADAPVSLSEWFRGYLTSGGAWYSKEANFSRNPPGTAFTYSNQAAALSALAVEKASGEPFDRYWREHIFTPLGMRETSYRLAELDPSHIAMPQAWYGRSFVELGHHGFPGYPAGTLRTSAPQLARFLLMVMNGGEDHDR